VANALNGRPRKQPLRKGRESLTVPHAHRDPRILLRYGMLTAKATSSVDERGTVELESARAMSRATDAPPPVCWATMPSDIGFMTKSARDSMQAAGKPETMAQVMSRYYHRAHPDWVMELPAAGSAVELSGMTRRRAARVSAAPVARDGRL
jgi:hypothetical protein